MAINEGSCTDEVLAAIDGVPAIQTSNPDDIVAYRRAIKLAEITAIFNHIRNNSELVPSTTDTGTAGAGIITGKVK